jgi:hypothetical protein
LCSAERGKEPGALKDTILKVNLFGSSNAKKASFNSSIDYPPQIVIDSLTLLKNLQGEVVG